MKQLLSLAFVLLLMGCATQELPSVAPQVALYPTVQSMDVLRTLSPVEMTREELWQALERAETGEVLSKAGLTEEVLDLAVRGLRARGYAELDCRRAFQGKRCPFQVIVLENREVSGLSVRTRYSVRPTKEQAFGLPVEFLSEARRLNVAAPNGEQRVYYRWERKEEGREIVIFQMEHPADVTGSGYFWDVIVTMPEEEK